MGQFTVYLIKPGYSTVERYQLVDGEVIEDKQSVFAEGVTTDTSLAIKAYLADKDVEWKLVKRSNSNPDAYYRANKVPIDPWWKSFWSITEQIKVQSADLIVFRELHSRLLVITHGQGRYLVNPLAIVHDFGLRAALNMIDPTRIRVTDCFTPSEIAMRETKRTGKNARIDEYQIDGLRMLLKAVAGKCKEQHQQLFQSIHGTDSFRFSFSGTSFLLDERLISLLDIYSDDTYKKTGFEWVDNYQQVKDRSTLDELDKQLVDAVNDRNEDVVISMPFAFDELRDVYFRFSRIGGSHRHGVYPNIEVSQYFKELDSAGDSITVDDIKRHKVRVLEEVKGDDIVTYSVYQCLYYEAKYQGKTYFIESGIWYHVSDTFKNRVDKDISALLSNTRDFGINYPIDDIEMDATKSGKSKEYVFNSRLTKHLNQSSLAELLDTSFISVGNSKIEICDVIWQKQKGNIALIHNKYKYGSSALSHLFSQGYVSIDALFDGELAQKANLKINDQSLKFPDEGISNSRGNYSVIYGIITKKNRNGEFTIPLFSKINLRQFASQLKRLGIHVEIAFIEAV